MRLIPLTGKRFGHLAVMRKAGHNAQNKILWLCRCDCGATTSVTGWDLSNNHTRSCGCLRDETCSERNRKMAGAAHPKFEHGKSKTAEYHAYKSAFHRCVRKESQDYPRYGGRGIKFLFASFEQFMRELGPKPSRVHSLDRINNNGNYELGNVRWATRSQQSRNRRKPHRKAA